MKITAKVFLAAALCVVSSAAWAEKDLGPCSTSSDCKSGGICLWRGAGEMRCIAGERSDGCAEGESKSCDKDLVCRNVIPPVRDTFIGKPKKEFHCLGHGAAGDLCAAEDAYTGSGTCLGNLRCRDTNGQYHCVAPGTSKQNEECLKADAGRGSIDCAGDLVCRNVSTTSPARYLCVGRGLLDDYCAEEDAHAGSKSCGGKLLCRAKNYAYRCVQPGKSKQGELCDERDAGHGSATCADALVCRDTGGGNYFCVGRGRLNDACAKADDGKGSKSCGGKLTCQNTGRSEWNCIGGGKAGDLCSEKEAGAGSWNCGGKLKCRQESDKKYRCR